MVSFKYLSIVFVMTISMQTFACDDIGNCVNQCTPYSLTSTCKSNESCYCGEGENKCYPKSDENSETPVCS